MLVLTLRPVGIEEILESHFKVKHLSSTMFISISSYPDLWLITSLLWLISLTHVKGSTNDAGSWEGILISRCFGETKTPSGSVCK